MDLQNFVSKSGDNNLCVAPQARFFVQWMCKQSKEEISEKYYNAAKCIYVEIVSALLVVGFTVLSTDWTKNLSKRYDEETVTPSDYTLFFRVLPEQSDIFDKILYKKHQDDSSRGQ